MTCLHGVMWRCTATYSRLVGARDADYAKMPERAFFTCSLLLVLLFTEGCRDKTPDRTGAAKPVLPATASSPSARNTHWDTTAGPLMLVSLGDDADSAQIVSPEVTDSLTTISDSIITAASGVTFDLFGRSGKIASWAVSPPTSASNDGRNCTTWPAVYLNKGYQGWKVGFVSGRVTAVPLDSIEGLSGADSAALAASLARTAATLPISSDPTFRRLPFRVRFAYRAHLDSSDLVIADIVRALNEEANPRIEHLFFIAERPNATPGEYDVRYYNRTAGAEETMQATEVLAAVNILASKRIAFVVNVESEEGSRLELLEATESGVWRPSWVGAETGC